MKYSITRSAIAAGIACVLSIGAMGCSFSSETTTTVSDGETTTTTTTKTENGETETTTMTTNGDADSAPSDISELKSYSIDDYGIKYKLPEGYKFTKVNENLDLTSGSDIGFEATNGDGATVTLELATTDANTDPWSDSFINEKKGEAEKLGDSMGLADVEVTTNELNITGADYSFPIICMKGTKDGKDTYVYSLYGTGKVSDTEKFVFELKANADSDEEVKKILEGFVLVL